LVVHVPPLATHPRLTTQVKPVGHSSPASGEHPLLLTLPMRVQKLSPANVSRQEQCLLSWHLYATLDGWKAVDPAATRAENRLLPVGQLGVGDQLLALVAVAVPVGAGGPEPDEAVAVRLERIPMRSVEARADDPATTLYNLLLDSQHTYFADELLVHNKTR
jgi:hypothetical protein